MFQQANCWKCVYLTSWKSRKTCKLGAIKMSGASLLFSTRLLTQRAVARHHGSLSKVGGRLCYDPPDRMLDNPYSSNRQTLQPTNYMHFTKRYASSYAKNKRYGIYFIHPTR